MSTARKQYFPPKAEARIRDLCRDLAVSSFLDVHADDVEYIEKELREYAAYLLRTISGASVSRALDAKAQVDASLVEHGVVPIDAIERAAIVSAMRRFGGNKMRSARALGVNIKTLYNKIARYEIDDREWLSVEEAP